MKKAIKLDTDDIKKIIADHFHVDVSRIIKAQYSYFVETDDEDTK